MGSSQRIAEFFNRIVTYTSVMKNCGEKITDQSIVAKILKTVSPNSIMVAIEESNKIKDLKVEELQRCLEASNSD